MAEDRTAEWIAHRSYGVLDDLRRFVETNPEPLDSLQFELGLRLRAGALAARLETEPDRLTRFQGLYEVLDAMMRSSVTEREALLPLLLLEVELLCRPLGQGV